MLRSLAAVHRLCMAVWQLLHLGAGRYALTVVAGFQTPFRACSGALSMPLWADSAIHTAGLIEMPDLGSHPAAVAAILLMNARAAGLLGSAGQRGPSLLLLFGLPLLRLLQLRRWRGARVTVA